MKTTKETTELFERFYDHVDGYKASAVMSAGLSIAIYAISEMIDSEDDLKDVMEDLENEVFPAFKQKVAENFNNPVKHDGVVH